MSAVKTTVIGFFCMWLGLPALFYGCIWIIRFIDYAINEFGTSVVLFIGWGLICLSASVLAHLTMPSGSGGKKSNYIPREY